MRRFVTVHVLLLSKQPVHFPAYLVHFKLQLRLPVACVLHLSHPGRRPDPRLSRRQSAEPVLRENALGNHLPQTKWTFSSVKPWKFYENRILRCLQCQSRCRCVGGWTTMLGDYTLRWPIGSPFHWELLMVASRMWDFCRAYPEDQKSWGEGQRNRISPDGRRRSRHNAFCGRLLMVAASRHRPNQLRWLIHFYALISQ